MPSFELEHKARLNGKGREIAGIDEAGRGPLAGPVFAAAVIIEEDYKPHWFTSLNDSKKLTVKRREELYAHLKADAHIQYSIAQSSVAEIDELNILQATYLAMARAANALSVKPEYCLIDGRPVPCFPTPSEGVIKGDSKSYSIAAASILAKVARDHYMLHVVARAFPAYEFHKHKGYGTKLHLEALQNHGVTPYHRRSFAPVQRILERDST